MHSVGTGPGQELSTDLPKSIDLMQNLKRLSNHLKKVPQLRQTKRERAMCWRLWNSAWKWTFGSSRARIVVAHTCLLCSTQTTMVGAPLLRSKGDLTSRHISRRRRVHLGVRLIPSSGIARNQALGLGHIGFGHRERFPLECCQPQLRPHGEVICMRRLTALWTWQEHLISFATEIYAVAVAW